MGEVGAERETERKAAQDLLVCAACPFQKVRIHPQGWGML